MAETVAANLKEETYPGPESTENSKQDEPKQMHIETYRE